MTRQMLTIGIPVYNSGETIAETLESCLKLPPEIVKILVSDNCSTDCTVDIVKEYMPRNNLKLFTQTTNLGAGNNFKFLLDECDTEYFMWLAGDDVIEKFEWDSIEKLFETYSSSIAVSPYALVDNRGALIPDNGNRSLINNDKIKNLLKFLISPGVNSRFYSIYKMPSLKKIHKRLFEINGGNFFASDIVFSTEVIKYGPWPCTNNFVLSRKPGISSDGWKLRFTYSSNILSAIFPSTKFISLIIAGHSPKNKFIIGMVGFVLYVRYLIGPLRHRAALSLGKIKQLMC